MRTILIVFAILLVLLTLLGTFGGSIKYKEPFYELSTLAEQEQQQGQEQQKLGFEDMPPSSSPPQIGGMDQGVADSYPVDDQPVESFYDAIPPTPGNYDKARFLDLPRAPQLGASQPQPPAVSNYEPSMEGFMIEPFEEDNRVSSIPAAY